MQRAIRGAWLLVALWLVAAGLLAWWDWHGRHVDPAAPVATVLRLWLFWASAAAPVVLAAIGLQAWEARRQPLQALAWLLLALPVAAGGWARLVEPELLRVRHSTIHTGVAATPPLRIALVADIHWGLFTRDHQLARLVERLNTLEVDAVLVAGDWTYEPRQDIAAGLAPLARLRHPVYAVLGNHDTQAPGPRIAAELGAALRRHGVEVIEGRRVPLKGWELAGLADLWGGQAREQAAALRSVPPTAPRLVLAHQPDTATLLPTGSATLMLAGHTHGGQVRLPWLTRRVLAAMTLNPWWDGHHPASVTGQVPVFVTPGTGTVGLPLRLGVPPTIDVIALQP